MNRSDFHVSVIIVTAICVILYANTSNAQTDPRIKASVERNADGSIKRSRTVLKDFVQIHPCPANNLPDVSCPGWAIDHVIPLASCGVDEIINLQWLPDAIKSCAGTECKDRWERKHNHCPETTP
jgi:hypothetical protein